MRALAGWGRILHADAERVWLTSPTLGTVWEAPRDDLVYIDVSGNRFTFFFVDHATHVVVERHSQELDAFVRNAPPAVLPLGDPPAFIELTHGGFRWKNEAKWEDKLFIAGLMFIGALNLATFSIYLSPLTLLALPMLLHPGSTVEIEGGHLRVRGYFAQKRLLAGVHTSQVDESVRMSDKSHRFLFLTLRGNPAARRWIVRAINNAARGHPLVVEPPPDELLALRR